VKATFPYPISDVPAEPPAGGGGVEVFETPLAQSINEARVDHLASLGLPIEGRSVLDVGCGVGHLAQFFVKRGCRVTCVDARSENIAQLRSLYPGLQAHEANVEVDRLAAFGEFDIVFCYGLLYHLENPVRGLRNLAEACSDLLLLESVISDCALPASRLIDEPASAANQAMGGLGCRPTPAFIVMTLNRVGFPYVYAPLKAPHHPDFEFEWRNDLEPARNGHLLRCIFVASRRVLVNSQLGLLQRGIQHRTDHATILAPAAQFGSRGWRSAARDGAADANLLAPPGERPLPVEWHDVPEASQELPGSLMRTPAAAEFRPGIACWNQRKVLAVLRERILLEHQAVNSPQTMTLYQYVQLVATVLEFRPGLILELGRGHGNSTCAFTAASNHVDGAIRVVSICPSTEWKRFTVPRLRSLVTDTWFAPLDSRCASIVETEYESILGGAQRVILYWAAPGFDVAECVLGRILPLLTSTEHLVLVHNLSDTRYVSRDHMDYGPHGLWRGDDQPGPRLKIGHVDSSASQAISVLDFTTRNRLTLESADHSLRADLSPEQQQQMRALLGDLFDTQAHWFYFTLKEHAGPYTFPRLRAP